LLEEEEEGEEEEKRGGFVLRLWCTCTALRGSDGLRAIRLSSLTKWQSLNDRSMCRRVTGVYCHLMGAAGG
jgi:hypothetical protein